MRGFGFYTRLAWQGMCKNGRVYLPYILTCIGMVMMYYIVCALQNSTAVETMRGGSTVQEILSLGQIVIGFFSLLFLLYTNSFLLKRRKKEFGLYNILGMSKLNLARVLLLETLLTAALALLSGLGLGLLFSKLAELSLSRLLSSGPSLHRFMHRTTGQNRTPLASSTAMFISPSGSLSSVSHFPPQRRMAVSPT